jgi:hypothetical protein
LKYIANIFDVIERNDFGQLHDQYFEVASEFIERLLRTYSGEELTNTLIYRFQKVFRFPLDIENSDHSVPPKIEDPSIDSAALKNSPIYSSMPDSQILPDLLMPPEIAGDTVAKCDPLIASESHVGAIPLHVSLEQLERSDDLIPPCDSPMHPDNPDNPILLRDSREHSENAESPIPPHDPSSDRRQHAILEPPIPANLDVEPLAKTEREDNKAPGIIIFK